METLVSADVAYVRRKPFRNQTINIVGCKYQSPPDNLGSLVDICKKIDAL